MVSECPRIKPGTVAGFKNWKGYTLLFVQGKKYRAHNLAWFYVYGEWPDRQIDHKDGNPSNNAISNLRLATRSQNQFNRRKQRNNTSGFKGVYWIGHMNKWLAKAVVRGKQHHLGYFHDAKEAHAAYCEGIKRLHGEYGRND